jgi:hypothetical protein
MRKFNLITLTLLFVSILFTSCEKDEDITPSTNNDSTVGSGSWSNGYWLRSSSGTYLDLTESKPVFCANGAIVGGTYSALYGINSNEAFFTLYNNGDEVKYKIEKSGANLILSPWDEASQATNNPSTYIPTSTFPCNPSISCTYSGGDVIIRPTAILSGERRPGNPIKFTANRNGWVNYECLVGNTWNFGDGSTGTGDEIEHAYSAKGTYVITLISTSSEGVTSTATKNITIL